MKDGSKVKFTSHDDPNIPLGVEGTIINIWHDDSVTVDFGQVGEWTVYGFELEEVA